MSNIWLNLSPKYCSEFRCGGSCFTSRRLICQRAHKVTTAGLAKRLITGHCFELKFGLAEKATALVLATVEAVAIAIAAIIRVTRHKKARFNNLEPGFFLAITLTQLYLLGYLLRANNNTVTVTVQVVTVIKGDTAKGQ
jgi:hypothetical protein